MFSFTSISLVVIECSPSSLETNTIADSSSSLHQSHLRVKLYFTCFIIDESTDEAKNPNTVTNDSVTVNKFLQASLLVGAVETSVSPWREQPVGLIGAFLKTVYHHWGVVERAAINDEIIYHPHLLLLA